MSDTPVYKVPTPEEVLAVRLRLNKLPLRRAFFSKLDNPHWVAALASQGAFKNPPATEVMPDGMVQCEFWPEIDYLVRMAPIVSADVADVLEPIAHSTNQWVRRGIAEAATVMDPADAARLVPKMKEWPGEELANFRIDSRHIAGVVVRLLEGGQSRRGLRLAEAYFAPRPSPEKPKYGIPEPVSGMESYWYGEELPLIAAALGSSRLQVLVRWLRTYQQCSNSFTGEPGFDPSYIWRQSIRDSEEHSAHGIGDALVDAVRLALADSVKDSTQTLSHLLTDDQPLLRRIALDVLTEAIESVDDKSAAHAASLTQHETELVAAAVQVLADEAFIESDYRAEYLPFIRACLAWRSVVSTEPFFEAVRKGPLSLRDGRQERFAREGDTPEESEARRQDYGKRWQHTMLTLVGAEELPEDLCASLATLDEEYGVIEVQDGAVRFETFTGSTSPIDFETMSALSNRELIEHLSSWHPEADRFMGPTHEGQGRVLAEVLTKEPGRFSGSVDDLKSLRPTYIRAVVRGWKAALEAGETLSWNEVLSLCEWIIGLDDATEVDSEGDSFDDDPNYKALKFEALHLLDAGLSIRPTETVSGVSAEEADRLFSLLARYAEAPEPTPEYEAEYGGTNMDPLTLSLNTVRPVAIRALIRLVNRFPETSAASEALAILDRHIAGRDPSLAVAAAVGEGTGRLYDSVRPWIEERVGAVFGDSVPTTEYQQVALSTVLAVHRVHMALIELLRQPLTLTIEQMASADLAAGWRHHTRTFPQLIGDWIVSGIVSGGMAHEDPLAQSWFEKADAALRGEVIGHLGWQLMRAESVSDDVLRRAAELWDWRIAHVKEHPEDAAELSHIYWLARSDKYEVDWWLPRLEYASSVVSSFDMHGMVGEKLAAAASVNPDRALRVLENVLDEPDSDRGLMHYDLMEHAVPQVIATALDCKDAGVRKRATDLMNRLGDGGYIALKARVDALRASSRM